MTLDVEIRKFTPHIVDVVKTCSPGCNEIQTDKIVDSTASYIASSLLFHTTTIASGTAIPSIFIGVGTGIASFFLSSLNEQRLNYLLDDQRFTAYHFDEHFRSDLEDYYNIKLDDYVIYRDNPVNKSIVDSERKNKSIRTKIDGVISALVSGTIPALGPATLTWRRQRISNQAKLNQQLIMSYNISDKVCDFLDENQTDEHIHNYLDEIKKRPENTFAEYGRILFSNKALS